MSVPKTDALPLGYTPMCLSVYVVQSGVVTRGPLHLYVYGATVLAHYVYVMSGLCALAPVSLIALHRDVLVLGVVARGPTVCALCYLLHSVPCIVFKIQLKITNTMAIAVMPCIAFLAFAIAFSVFVFICVDYTLLWWQCQYARFPVVFFIQLFHIEQFWLQGSGLLFGLPVLLYPLFHIL